MRSFASGKPEKSDKDYQERSDAWEVDSLLHLADHSMTCAGWPCERCGGMTDKYHYIHPIEGGVELFAKCRGKSGGRKNCGYYVPERCKEK